MNGMLPRASGRDGLERDLPEAIDSEMVVVGSCILLPEILDDVMGRLKQEHFYDEPLGQVYASLCAMRSENRFIDAKLLHQRLVDGGMPTHTAFVLLGDAATAVPNAMHYQEYVDHVVDAAGKRSLIFAGRKIAQLAYEDGSAGELQARAEQMLQDVGDRQVYGSSQGHGMSDCLTQALALLDDPSKRRRLVTRFADLDKHIAMTPGSLIVIAGRPSMGKTVLGVNIATSVAQRQPVLFVSLEMSSAELTLRILSSTAEIPFGRLAGDEPLDKYDSQAVSRTLTPVSEMMLTIVDESRQTVADIAACARRIKRREGLGLIVIDYLQLIEPDNSRDQRQEQVSKISRRLKQLARDLDVPVICLAQINRLAETSRDNRPRLSHLRESGAIEQDADVVLFVHREEMYAASNEEREQLKGKASVIVAKQRNGVAGIDVDLTFRGEFVRFDNAASANFASDWNYPGVGS